MSGARGHCPWECVSSKELGKAERKGSGGAGGVLVGCKEKQGGQAGRTWLGVSHSKLSSPPLP